MLVIVVKIVRILEKHGFYLNDRFTPDIKQSQILMRFEGLN